MKTAIKPLPFVQPFGKSTSLLKPVLFLLMLIFCLSGHKSLAQTPVNFQTRQPFLFEENKGQLTDQEGQKLPDIKYYGKQGGVYVYCKLGMISFVFTKIETDKQVSEATGLSVETGHALALQRQPQPTKISTSRMDLVLVNANPNAEITASEQQEYYENFFNTGDANQGIPNVHTYKTVTYKSIYPDIDMILNTSDKGMEYSFLVHPGGNVNDIKLRWNGSYKEKTLENGGIK